jgi:hypothetical protein
MGIILRQAIGHPGNKGELGLPFARAKLGLFNAQG